MKAFMIPVTCCNDCPFSKYNNEHTEKYCDEANAWKAHSVVKENELFLTPSCPMFQHVIEVKQG